MVPSAVITWSLVGQGVGVAVVWLVLISHSSSRMSRCWLDGPSEAQPLLRASPRDLAVPWPATERARPGPGAAEQLGVSYKTLLNKIKECGISRK